MRLLDVEQRVLGAIEMHGDRSVKEIQNITGLRQHTIRYNLQRLAEKGIICSKRPFVDLSRSGLIEYALYFSLITQDTNKREKLLQKFLRSPLVVWLFELAGEFQYGMSICAEDITEMVKLLERVSLRFGNIFFDKSISVRTGFTYYGRRYLDIKTTEDRRVLQYGSPDQPLPIDSIDRKILWGMTNLEYRSFRELAGTLHVPVSTFERHRRRLGDIGLIKGYYYRIHPEYYGMQQYKLLVYVRGIDPRLTRELREVLKTESFVTYLIECMGSWDYEIGVEVSSIKELTQISQRLYNRFPTEITSIREIPVISYLKFHKFPYVKEHPSTP